MMSNLKTVKRPPCTSAAVADTGGISTGPLLQHSLLMVDNSKARCLLTFQPALDDVVELKAFLTNVVEQYNIRRSLALQTIPSISSSAGQEAGITPAKPQAKKSKISDANISKSKKKKKSTSKRSSSETTLERYHRLKDSAYASVRLQNNVDYNIEDPEKSPPPQGETPVEKKRRLERINGRRKRARKAIEMEHLNEQFVDYDKQNQFLKMENEELKKRIDLLKRSMMNNNSTGGGADVASQVAALRPCSSSSKKKPPKLLGVNPALPTRAIPVEEMKLAGHPPPPPPHQSHQLQNLSYPSVSSAEGRSLASVAMPTTRYLNYNGLSPNQQPVTMPLQESLFSSVLANQHRGPPLLSSTAELHQHHPRRSPSASASRSELELLTQNALHLQLQLSQQPVLRRQPLQRQQLQQLGYLSAQTDLDTYMAVLEMLGRQRSPRPL